MLYRTNAQSNALEYALKRNGVPYKMVGGTKFFDRAEVKDMLAYLCVLNNPLDDLRLRRIINVPARAIGAATVEKAEALAAGPGRVALRDSAQCRPLSGAEIAGAQAAEICRPHRRTA
jgi:DNA helicase-2/ATP-dependent DNA helicase PcrA